MPVASDIKRLATTLGFDAVGIASVPSPSEAVPAPPAGFLAQLRQRLLTWLDAGRHGTLSWLARDPDRRADPRRVLPGCRSVIVVAMNYDTGHHAPASADIGRIARYAWGRDYHHILGTRLASMAEHLAALAPGHQHRWYVDTGPVMEKAWAQQAGLGWIGKHSNLVSPQHGSWLVLGEILTTLELDADPAGSDLCGSCSLCINACPTGAIADPYVVDARRCISYLTIEHRGDDVPVEIAPHLGSYIFGCDDCLDVCPYNTQARPTSQPDFQPLPWTLRPALTELQDLTESEFLRRTEGSPLRRAKFLGFLRNVRQARRNAATRAPSAAPPIPTP